MHTVVGLGLGVVAAVLVVALPAKALCQLPDNPAVFCGAGATAVVAHAIADQGRAPPGGVVVVVDEIGGAPMAGLAVGDELALGPADDAITIAIGNAVDTQTLFVLRDFGTWTRAAPVVEGRVWIAADGEHTIASDDVLDLVALDDERSCVDQSNEVVDPRVFNGPCNDTLGPFGCAATPGGIPLTATVLLLLRRRRR